MGGQTLSARANAGCSRETDLALSGMQPSHPEELCMEVTVELAADGLSRITIVGEMTIYNAMELKDKLLLSLAQCETVEMNLVGVSEIDSAGLQLLLMLKTEAAVRNKTLSITSHSPAVLDVLDLCELEGFFGDNVLVYPQK